jgi:hypothetical protein
MQRESNKLLVVHNYKALASNVCRQPATKYRLGVRELTGLFDTHPFRDVPFDEKYSRYTRGFVASNDQLRSLNSLHDKEIDSEKVWNGRDQPTLFCHGICRMNVHSLLVMQVYGLDLCIYYMRHYSMTSVVPRVTFSTHASTIHS